MYAIVSTTIETEFETAVRDYYRDDGAGISLDLCNGEYAVVQEFETKADALKALSEMSNEYGMYVTNWGRRMFEATEYWVTEGHGDFECTDSQNLDWEYCYDRIH